MGALRHGDVVACLVTVVEHPAGGQDMWHLHVHVLPRFLNDDLYQRHLQPRWVTTSERRPFADTLRTAMNMLTSFV